MLPVNNSKYNHPINNADVISFNKELKAIANNQKSTFIDTYNQMLDSTGQELEERYSFDGVHLSGEGYIHLKTVLEEFVME